MKQGDLVRVRADTGWGEGWLHVYPRHTSVRGWAAVSPGETVMLLHSMTADDVGGYIDVLHPKHGVCSILRKALEAV